MQDSNATPWTIRAIRWCFYGLFLLTPLLYYSANYELFEFNKMIFVYFLTSLIACFWLLTIIKEQAFRITRTPLDIPILLYLAANVVTTIISIDPHVSWFGYYSRFNGGLLSTIAYTVLFFAFTTFCAERKLILRLLLLSLASAIYVAGYAVLQRLGIDNNKWVQDVQARVFSTLGQPNWLAAYLAMLIPVSVVAFLQTKVTNIKLIHLGVCILYYIAFTFTYSRGGTLGLFAGLAVLSLTVLIPLYKPNRKSGIHALARDAMILLGVIVLSFVLFGNALWRDSSFKGVVTKKYPPAVKQAGGTALERGGSETGQIRLIVWQGAWDIFKQSPIFGTGVETFAYSYYQFRPATHNHTSEWDFIYNKAHNEYLNELATKGLVGFIPYLLLIGGFLWTCTRYLLKTTNEANAQPLRTTKTSKNSTSPSTASASTSWAELLLPQDIDTRLVVAALVAGYISYLVQNIFGFGVVIIVLYFYLFPAMVYGLIASTRPDTIRLYVLPIAVLGNSTSRAIANISTALLVVYLFVWVGRLWVADTFYASGYNNAISGNITEAYQDFETAYYLNSHEPLYQSQLGYVASELVDSALQAKKTDLAQQLKEDAIGFTTSALATSPKNVIFLRTATKTYLALSLVDPAYTSKAIETAQRVTNLSPTDPSDWVRLGQMLHYVNRDTEAKQAYEKAIALKPDYRNARYYYAQLLLDLAQQNPDQAQTLKNQAKLQLETSLQQIASPDAEIEQLLATISAHTN